MCTCPKPGPIFPTSNVVVFLCSVNSIKMRGNCSFFYIGGIDDHHCLNFLLNNMAFQSLAFERIWWRLFLLFWAYLMKVIMSVSDEGYYERTWWRLFWAYLMKVNLSVSDEGYSWNASCALNLISTFLFFSW